MVTIRYRQFYICDAYSERSLDWPIDSLIYTKFVDDGLTVPSDQWWKIDDGAFTEVPEDEVIFVSPIPISKLLLSGVPDDFTFIKSDGSHAQPVGTGPIITDGVTITGQGILGDPLTVPPPASSGTYFVGAPSVIFVGGLDVQIIWPTFFINGVEFDAWNITIPPNDTVTLAAADATFNRFDAIYMDSGTGLPAVITGTPSANPEQPPTDPTTQLLVTYVLVEANQTDLTTNDVVVYDEGSETTVASNNGTLETNSTDHPLSGSVSIELGSFNNTHYIDFTFGSTQNRVDISQMLYYLWLKSTFSNSTYFKWTFYNAGVPVSNTVNITTGLYNFVRTTVGSFQTIVVPMSAFTFTSGQFDKIRLTFNGSNTDGFWFDFFVLQAGVSGVSPSFNFFKTILDNVGDAVIATEPNDTVTLKGLVKTGTKELTVRLNYLDLPSQGDIDDVGNPAADTGRITAIKKDDKVVLVYSDEHGIRTRIMRDNIVIVRNTSGSGMTKGQVVYPSGATGLFPNVSLSDATAKATLRGSMILIENVSNNAYGYAMRLGLLENFDTSAFSIGDRLYVSASTPGALTTTAPSIEQSIGIVLVSGVGNGAILVDVETPSSAGGSGTPGGSDTEVQFNDGGSFGGDADWTYNKTTNIQTIAGGVIINAETASRIAHFDGSKQVKALDTATYPTLTELSYVKGVTSAIQTQIDGNNYWRTVPGTPTRVGNTSFTITDTGNANLYDKLLGRRTVLKWTDTTTKMAMVVSATYATDTVTVTIIGDTLAASATMSTFKYAIQKADYVTFAIAGTIATGTNLSRKWKASCATKVFGADALHGTAGTTNSTVYDLNKNGTTMFTTKVSISSGATVGNGFTANDGTTLATDDVVDLDCDSVSTTNPVDVYVDLFTFPLNNQYYT